MSNYLLLGLLGSLNLDGLRSPGSSSWNAGWLSPSSDTEATASVPPQGELPPKEAARACMVTAEELQKSGHLEQAISLYEKARQRRSQREIIAHRLAVLYDAQGDSTRSLAEYNKALESDPKNPSLLSDFGYYYYERGNQAEAERLLRRPWRSTRIIPRRSAILGMVLAAEGRPDEFPGIRQGGRPRRGPFQPWRAAGEARAL